MCQIYANSLFTTSIFSRSKHKMDARGKNLMFGLLIYFGGTGIYVHTNMLMESVNAINKGTIRSHNVVQLLI